MQGLTEERGKMPFTLFYEYFPEIAERETRSIIITPHSKLKLPAGEYAFLEMFCDEPGCDCRRVFISVLASFSKELQAVIAWGWEDLAFYSNWMKSKELEQAEYLKGPSLNIGSPITNLSNALLELAQQVLLKDEDYVQRIQRHYKMFRDKIDGRKDGRLQKK
jgi:hypothetical protein